MHLMDIHAQKQRVTANIALDDGAALVVVVLPGAVLGVGAQERQAKAGPNACEPVVPKADPLTV